MCDIIGIISDKPVAPQLVDAVRRLEYCGYDSAGVATLEIGELAGRRAEAKLKNLEARLFEEPLSGPINCYSQLCPRSFRLRAMPFRSSCWPTILR